MVTNTRNTSCAAAGRPFHFLRPAAVAVALCFGTGTALANPTGATVVNGQVSIQQMGNLLQVTNSPNAIVNWQSFSINANEITRFLQQSSSSAVLNRVTGAGGAINPSIILGALQSNGRVFLINPSGIVFGAGAQIDVAGLVASSLNLSNQDFLAGRLRFTDVPGAGAVVNQGNINAATGGQVYLVGPSVTNSGVITTPKGEVVLAAGNSVELVNPGTPNLRVEISAPDNQARNLGRIVADAGRVGIYAGLIEQKGEIRADSAVVGEDGRVILKATRNVTLDAGSVTSADGSTGGSIEISARDTAFVAGTVQSGGGISLVANDMDIAATVSAGAGISVQPFSAGRAIDLGSNVGGSLSLTQSEIDNLVTTGNVLFGSPSGGPIAISSAFNMTGPAHVTLHSGSTITANAGVNVSGFLGAAGTDFTTNAVVTVGGGLSVSGANIAINAPFTVGGNALLSGTNITANAPVTVGGNLSTTALTTTIAAPVSAQQVSVTTDQLTLTDTVTGADSVSIATTHFRPIELGVAASGGGGVLYLTATEMNTLLRGPVVRIGSDLANGIQINGTIAPTGANHPDTLILHSGNLITQGPGRTVAIANLGLRARSDVMLTEDNAVGTLAAFVEPLCCTPARFAFTNAPGSTPGTPLLTIGTVDSASPFGPLSGIRNPGGGAIGTITADKLDIASPIVVETVNIKPRSPLSVGLDLGGADSPTKLGLSAGDLANVSANVLTLRANQVDITAPVTSNSDILAIAPVTPGLPLNIVTSKSGPGALEFLPSEIARVSGSSFVLGDPTTGAIAVNAAVSVPDSLDVLTLRSGAGLAINQPISANGATVGLVADSMMLGAVVESAHGNLLVAPNTTGRSIDLGSKPANALGLLASELSGLSAPNGTLFIGNSITGDVNVSAPLDFGSASAVLATGVNRTISVATPLTTAHDLTLMSDNISLNALISGANVTLATVGPNRTLDLGTLGSGTSLGLDAASLGLIAASESLTFKADNSASSAISTTIVVSKPVAFASPNLTLLADTINVNGTLAAPGNINLLADAMAIANTVSSTGGGIITVAPSGLNRLTNGMELGSTGVFGPIVSLQLSNAEVNQFSTTGALRLGGPTTYFILIEAPISTGSVGALSLSSADRIMQTPGSTITAANLSVRSAYDVDLPENNSVGMLSGSVGVSMTFTAAGTLTIGTVDGVTGLSGGSLNLKADNLTLAANIGNSSATLAPRNAGVPIDLGSKPVGVFGIDGVDLGKITSFNLTFGDNTTGPVMVSAPMQRSSGTFNIVTAPSQAVNVNAALDGPSGVRIDAGTINVAAPITAALGSVGLTARAPETLNIGAPVFAQLDVDLVSDVMNISAPVTSQLGSVSIAPVSSLRPIDLGTETVGSLSLTQGELALISASRISIGNSSTGPTRISAPITLSSRELSLSSAGSITQDPGAPIVFAAVDSFGQRIGSLAVYAFNGNVDLRAVNEVPDFLSGFASGDFDFNNLWPLLPQNVNVFALGQVRITSSSVPITSGSSAGHPPADGALASGALGPLMSAIDNTVGINDVLDDDQDPEKKRQAADR
jgi:filamentous hemagglutinin family protein